jgi:ParB-like chromosome segregation protein Spo0J
MEIKNVKIENIKKAGYNPRIITPSEFAKLKKSIKEFGVVRPLIINKRTENLVSGHQTLDAAKECGLKTVPVIEVDLDEAHEKALNVALNKIQGEWEYTKLNEVLEEIKDLDVFECSGFDLSDIDLMEKLNDDGSLISDEPATKVKTPTYEVTFEFDNEADMIYIKNAFETKRYGWKDDKKPNSNLLKKLIEKQNGKD